MLSRSPCVRERLTSLADAARRRLSSRACRSSSSSICGRARSKSVARCSPRGSRRFVRRARGWGREGEGYSVCNTVGGGGASARQLRTSVQQRGASSHVGKRAGGCGRSERGEKSLVRHQNARRPDRRWLASSVLPSRVEPRPDGGGYGVNFGNAEPQWSAIGCAAAAPCKSK